MREDIKPGVKFPDYELPDHLNVKRKLSYLQGDDPMILVLSRGYFCPKDRQQMHQLVQFSSQCAVGYSKIVTISTDTLLTVNEFRMGVGADWPFLYDEERVVQKDLDIKEYTDPKHNPMIPYTIVLEPGLVIYKIYQGYWYWGRPSTAELHQDLRNVSKKVRPDYKIDNPELQEKWEKEQKEAFWPYGKDWEKAIAHMNGATDRY